MRSSDPCGDPSLRRRRRRTACITFFLLDTDNYLIAYPTEQQQHRSQSKIHARSRAYVSPAVIKLICIIKRRLLARRTCKLYRPANRCRCVYKRARVCVYPRVYNLFYTRTENIHHQATNLRAFFARLSKSLSL